MEQTDFLVIGSGLAGLTFALEAAEHGEVVVLTKAAISDSNTNWAQGGIAAAVGESDSWELHEQDTLTAGAGLCDPAAVRFLVQQAPAAIEWLRERGARFDLTASNSLDLGREGGHSRHRIVHHADKTGWEVERTVTAAVRQNPRIRVFEDCFVTRLLIENGECLGAMAHLGDLGEKVFSARATMLATGGCGQLYANTTNPRVATADGIALALDAGAEIRDMEFMQFHPTTLFHKQISGYLVTEAVRGAGGTLRNHNGRRFMFDYDPRLELAPRDVVARSIQREIEKLDTWCVYLDASHLPTEQLHTEFPTIWSRLRELGIEMEKEWIPVVPAQHYSCGGIVTDLNGATSIPRLFASGEVASTGVHGANRLASNSLLEAIVFSSAAAQTASRATSPSLPSPEAEPTRCLPEHEAIRIRHALQRNMSNHAGIFRTTKGLQSMKKSLEDWTNEAASLQTAEFSAYAREATNMIAAARCVVEGALARAENIGLHFNADYE